MTVRLAQALVDCPVAALLRELRLDDEMSAWDDAEVDPPPRRVQEQSPQGEWLNVFELVGSPCLSNLRVLQVGSESGKDSKEGWTDCHCYSPGLPHFVAACPRIEELWLMTKSFEMGDLFALPSLTNLRILHVEHCHHYPVAVLAKNPAMTNLEHIYFHPHFAEWDGSPLPRSGLRNLGLSPHLQKLTRLYYHITESGDDGIQDLIETGLLARLKVLSLRHGCVTDAGLRMLETSAATRGLELLDLRRNQLTAKGVKFRRMTGVNLLCDHQHPVGGTEFLTEGDFE